MIPTPALHPEGTQPRPPCAARRGISTFDSPPIDSESAALLRCWLQPLIARSSSWEALSAALARRGYALGFRDGRLCLTNRQDGTCICTMRFLGAGLTELVGRLGRPVVRPLPGRPAAGVLCPRPRG